ncbi:MAG: hypothetical protein QF915_04130 [Candidatus Woesearchaeota archaeon]|nr:hypothetical protein [Candidatus Woesearchaeota archaeon]MDP7457198.1 hypothetical protein [Candidatus Woesearchaeota archaeon]
MSNRLMQRRGRETINKRSPRKKRPKTFKSEEAAKKWAEKKKITEHRLVHITHPDSKKKKIKVVRVKKKST